MNCTEPPSRFPSGTWEWSGDYSFETQIVYTCGPYGKFEGSDGRLYKKLIAECMWNKTWSPPELDPCKGFGFNLIIDLLIITATACAIMPEPPPSTGLVIAQGPSSSGKISNFDLN